MSIKAVAGTVAVAAGEAALSSFFNKLFDKLSFSDLLKTFRKENFDADLRKWKRMLLKIQAVLDDAEEKQVTNRSVKIWLDELEDLAYDVDDILDEFATEALRRELNPEPKSKIPKVFGDNVGSNRDFVKLMRSKIEGIDRRLQEIVEEKKDLELRENTGGRTITTTSRPPSTSLVNESRTYGRDEEKKEIVKLLLESSDAQLSVIPIVGMGGLGKTTLAQLVYDEVSRHFELKAWVCVSEDFDNLRLTKEILHSFTSESCHDNNNLDSLQGKLKNTLSGKKFLLILDDVWNENYELWTELRKPFEYGVQGSKIVVTTRNDSVSSIMGTNPSYKLKELSRDACLRVFTHHALEATDFSEYPELEKYGHKIVDRCKGAPLAAKALGGLLRNKYDPYEWEDVLNSKIWDIPQDKSSIFPVLKLSYHYLPSHLKRCFAYCSLFPKDNEFEEKELVLLWMAEGLVQETKRKKPMEDLGGDYFRDLLNRSFFQQSSSGGSLFVMHDLMNDLAMWAVGDLCCRLEDQLGGSKQSEISTKVRHFSYIEHSNFCIQKFDEDVHLRTFLSLPLYNKYGLTHFDVKYCLFPQLRCLRVLSLSGNDIFELPSSIGDLKHLRYLNLSYTKITILPESTSSLYNLQTLILKGCDSLTKLPEKIENLVNLRHLNISNANSIREMPAGIAKLKSLQTLSNFVVGKDKIVDLMNLESLQGTLCISHLENMLDANDARKVNLKGKNNLDTLVMKWNDGLQDARVATGILDMLKPHGTMKMLSIKGFVGAEFPTWLGDPSFSNMVDLRIERCGKCMFLPAFGQLPSLKHLVIMGMDRVESIGPEFYGKHCKQPFRSLVKLCFEDMIEWQDWIPCRVECEEFPSLRELSISNCRKLKGKLPHHLPSLEKLSTDSCEQLVVSFPSLSMLKEVKIVRCKDVVVDGFVKAEKLKITYCQEVTSLSLLNIKLKSTLRTLTIKECSALESLEVVMDEGGASSLVPLDIEIESCLCLQNIKLKSTSLRALTIKDCYYLKFLEFVMDEGGASSLVPLDINIESCQFLVNVKLKSTVRTLAIKNCSALESLEFVMDEGGASSTFPLLMNEENRNNNVALLEHLEIYNCQSLKRVSTIVDPSAMLKRLDIGFCPNLTSLSSKGILPTTLKVLSVRGCPKLELIVDELHKDTLLEDLVIHDCEKLGRLPRGLHELRHLKEIGLSLNCISFPEEGFPTNLRKLILLGENLCEQVFELGRHRLTSLTYLEIGYGIMDSFPEEEDGKTTLMLPTSLTTLIFFDFPNLLFLSGKFFQNLSALEQISIFWCPKLASLSEECFPPSLQRLSIYHCPVLEQNYEKDGGIMWSKIANIPSVKIDDREQQK